MGASGALQIFEEVGSTNDVVRELAEKGGAHGAAVAARRQTAGRGRRGHVWESPLGNLYLSILLLQIAGVSNEVQLKWPNDLLARERKLGGILVEAFRDSAGDAFAVCGIGINLETSPRALSAICLAELGAPVSFSVAAEALRDAIAARVDAWSFATGERPLDGIRDDYLAHLAWRGEKVLALSPVGEPLAAGVLEGVDPWGRAVVDGTAYAAEQASLRPAP